MTDTQPAVTPPAAGLWGHGVRLREWTAADVGVLVAGCNEPAVRRWFPHLPVPYTLERAAAWIASRPAGFARGTDLCFAVEDPDGVVVGAAAIPRRDPANGVSEVSYWILPTARGSGFAPAAVRTLVDWAFGVLGDGRVELMAAPENTASCRVAEKAGLTAEAVLAGREATREGGRRDLRVYAVLATPP